MIVMSPKAAAGAGIIKRRSKMGNDPIVVGGVRWDSKSEYERWLVLLSLKAEGCIRNLGPKPRFEFDKNGVRLGHYTADFKYEKRAKGAWVPVVEDWKGWAHAAFWKQMLKMVAYHGIHVLITSRHGEWLYNVPGKGKRPAWLQEKKNKRRYRK